MYINFALLSLKQCKYQNCCLAALPMNVCERMCANSGVRRKFSWGGFHSVACGGHLYLVCAVCEVTVWRHIQVTKPMFSRTWLTQYAYSSIRTPLNLCVTALNINSQRSRLRYRRNINSTLRRSSISQLRKYLASRENRGVKHTHHRVRAIYNCKIKLR